MDDAIADILGDGPPKKTPTPAAAPTPAPAATAAPTPAAAPTPTPAPATTTTAPAITTIPEKKPESKELPSFLRDDDDDDILNLLGSDSPAKKADPKPAASAAKPSTSKPANTDDDDVDMGDYAPSFGGDTGGRGRRRPMATSTVTKSAQPVNVPKTAAGATSAPSAASSGPSPRTPLQSPGESPIESPGAASKASSIGSPGNSPKISGIARPDHTPDPTPPFSELVIRWQAWLKLDPSSRQDKPFLFVAETAAKAALPYPWIHKSGAFLNTTTNRSSQTHPLLNVYAEQLTKARLDRADETTLSEPTMITNTTHDNQTTELDLSSDNSDGPVPVAPSGHSFGLKPLGGGTSRASAAKAGAKTTAPAVTTTAPSSGSGSSVPSQGSSAGPVSTGGLASALGTNTVLKASHTDHQTPKTRVATTPGATPGSAAFPASPSLAHQILPSGPTVPTHMYEASLAERTKLMSQLGELQSLLQAQQSEIASLKGELGTVQMRQGSDVQGVRQEYEEKINQLEAVHALDMQRHFSSENIVRQELERKERAHLADLRKTEDQHQRMVDGLQQDKADAVRQVERRLRDEIARMSEVHSQDLEIRAQRHTDAMEMQRRMHQQELESLQQQLDSMRSLGTLSREVHTSSATLEEMRVKMQADFEAALSLRQQTLDNKERSLKQQEEKMLAQQRYFDEERLRMQTLNSSMELTMRDLRSKQEQEDARLMREQTRVDSLLASLQAERTATSKALAEERRQLEQIREAKMREKESLYSEIADERERLSQERASFAAQQQQVQAREAAAAQRLRDRELAIDAERQRYQLELVQLEDLRRTLEREREGVVADRYALDQDRFGFDQEVQHMTEMGLALKEKSEELVRIREEAVNERIQSQLLRSECDDLKRQLSKESKELEKRHMYFHESKKKHERDRVQMVRELQRVNEEKVAASRAEKAARKAREKFEIQTAVAMGGARGSSTHRATPSVLHSQSQARPSGPLFSSTPATNARSFSAPASPARRPPPPVAALNADFELERLRASSSLKAQAEFLDHLAGRSRAAPAAASMPPAKENAINESTQPPPSDVLPPDASASGAIGMTTMDTTMRPASEFTSLLQVPSSAGAGTTLGGSSFLPLQPLDASLATPSVSLIGVVGDRVGRL